MRTRRNFLTSASSCGARRPNQPGTAPHADLQTHSTDSDGSLELADMAEAAAPSGPDVRRGHRPLQSLKIVHGQDAEELPIRAGGSTRSTRVRRPGVTFRVLQSIEMDVFATARATWMRTRSRSRPGARASTRAAGQTDATERYLAALANPRSTCSPTPRPGCTGGARAWSRTGRGCSTKRRGWARRWSWTRPRRCQDLNVEMADRDGRGVSGSRWAPTHTCARAG